MSRYYLVRACFASIEESDAFTQNGEGTPTEEVLVDGGNEADRISANLKLESEPTAWFKSLPPHNTWSRGKDLFTQGIFFKSK